MIVMGFAKMKVVQTFQKGFTLIEVMAAVAVFTIAAIGLYSINQQTVLTASRLENKTFAFWVAQNAFNELEMKGELKPAGKSDQKVEMANTEWSVKVEIEETKAKKVNKVVIFVLGEDQVQYAKLEGFIASKIPEAP